VCKVLQNLYEAQDIGVATLESLNNQNAHLAEIDAKADEVCRGF
jgi:hypothetical protein